MCLPSHRRIERCEFRQNHATPPREFSRGGRHETLQYHAIATARDGCRFVRRYRRKRCTGRGRRQRQPRKADHSQPGAFRFRQWCFPCRITSLLSPRGIAGLGISNVDRLASVQLYHDEHVAVERLLHAAHIGATADGERNGAAPALGRRSRTRISMDSRVFSSRMSGPKPRRSWTRRRRLTHLCSSCARTLWSALTFPGGELAPVRWRTICRIPCLI